MRRVLSLLLVFLALSACAAPAGETEAPPAPPAQEAPEPPAPAETSPEEDALPEEIPGGDRVLLTLEAPLADGRALTLEAVGKVEDEYTCGVREVRVYDGAELIQTVRAREANMAFWGDGEFLPGESVSEYTSCWKPEGSMTALDLNFDGNTDLGLFGWPANNIIPYYYWIWDAETEQYRYAFVLHEAEANPETKELTSEYKSGEAGSQWIKEVYKPDENGDLYLVRLERDTCDFEPAPPGYLDFDRGWAEETWVPPEGRKPISPRNDRWSIENDLVLVRREVPVYEDNGDGTVSHFTEIWELQDGGLKLVSREEYAYEEQP